MCLQEADVAIGSLTVTSARESVIDFTSSFMDFTMAVLMKKPKLHGRGYFQFLKPFTFGMWISIIVAVSCIVFTRQNWASTVGNVTKVAKITLPHQDYAFFF